MKLFKKVLSLFLIVAMMVAISSCRNDTTDEPGNDDQPQGDAYTDYTVTVLNPLGYPVSDVTVFVHEDGGEDYNVCTTPIQTDKDGKAVFTLEAGKNYSVGFFNVPAVYSSKSGNTRAERYHLDTASTEIVLTANEGYQSSKYRLGDFVPNVRIEDIDGNGYDLYELLKTKKAVVLNFWFCSCGPCQSEFPALNSAYNTHKDNLELFAINDVDSSASIKSYPASKGLTLDMPLVKGTSKTILSPSAFNSNAYPTTVVIDRSGRVTFIHVNVVTDKAQWNKLFAYFTSEDYTSTVVTDFNDIK